LNPSSIILPTLISSTIATAVGVILTKIFCNKKSPQGAFRTSFCGVVRKIKDRSTP
jgi:spore maturation protein SpmA